MSDGNYSIIETKLANASGCAENIKGQQLTAIKEKRAGLNSLENAKKIIELLWEVMSQDLPALVKEYEKTN